MNYAKSLVKIIPFLGVIALALMGTAAPASAQTYVCPPGYYFLAGYGCYPFSGYRFVPPPVYSYGPYPYYAPFGLSFRFGGPDHFFRGHDRDRGHFGHGGRR